MRDRHLSFFLANFLALMTIFVPMVGESRPARITIDLTFAIMLFSGAIATVHKRVLMYLIIALTILEFTADLLTEFNPAFSPRGLGQCPQGVLHGHTCGHDAETDISSSPAPFPCTGVMGGVAAYLLIGVTCRRSVISCSWKLLPAQSISKRRWPPAVPPANRAV